MWTKRECKLLWTLAIVFLLYPMFILDAKEISASEPVLTWNLFLTLFLVPLSVTLLGIYQGRRLDKQAKGWEAYHAEVKEHQIAWRKATTETLCMVKNTLDNIERDMNKKVSKTDCDDRSEKKWAMINHHSHNEKGKVVVE